MKARFPIGMTFTKKRFPKAKDYTTYTIKDIYKTYNSIDQLITIQYVISHLLCGQEITERVCDTTIARCLSNEQLAMYLGE